MENPVLKEFFEGLIDGLGKGHGEVLNEALSKKIQKIKSKHQKEKDAIYNERDRILAFLCKVLCNQGDSIFAEQGNIVYLTRHQPEDGDWKDDWRNVVVIESINYKPMQLSWHIHDSHLPLFSFLPQRKDWKWDGHTTEEKYRRMEEF